MFGKSIKILMLTFCIFIGSFITSNALIYRGDVYHEPEEGWTRYDHNSGFINYIGEGWEVLDDRTRVSGFAPINNENGYPVSNYVPNIHVEFEFEGTGFRIATKKTYTNRVEFKVLVDGEYAGKYVVHEGSDYRYYLNFRHEELENKVHHVKIVPIYFGGDPRYSYEYSIQKIDILGEMISDNGTINEEENVVLDVEPQKEKIKIDEEVVADLTINNINEISAEDIRIKYDSSKLEYLGYEEVQGIKLIKDIQNDDEIRVILASQGEANIINAKEVLLRLKFRGTTSGQALVNVTKGRVTDGIEMERDLEESECGKGIILIEEQEGFIDVNNSGEFTLLDLGIDARHLNKDPNVAELSEYNTDIIEDGSINDIDLLEIGKLMLENGNYTPNNY